MSVLAAGMSLLRPEDQVFSAMLDGWRNQQLARNLSLPTIEGRERTVQAFAAHAEAFPWSWTPQLADEWFGDLRAVRHLKRSTLRTYQEGLRSFCGYVTDPVYGWQRECEERFGTHPVQVCHEWNSAVHVQDAEADAGKRPFTRDELQAFFDHADEQVARVRRVGRKGWLPAFRDATLFKVAYAFGLRRNETRMLDVADVGRNPHADEFGEFGVLYVRFGKAMKGSAPKRRSVLTVWPWIVDVLEQWANEVRPLFGVAGNLALWPSERSPRVGLQRLNSRFGVYRDALALPDGLDFHSFRRSYVTHLIEDGWDPLFVRTRSAMSTHRRRRSTRACRRTSVPARCGEHLTRRCRLRSHCEEEATMRREVSYRWRLREIMAVQGMFTTTELVPLLAERGINLSASQVHRLVTGTPERLSLPVLAALCDIFECTPAELIATTATNVASRKTATAETVTDMAAMRPRRARVLPDR